MPSDGEEIVTFRLAPRDRAAIQRLVDAGEFRNRSDFLRYAIKRSLQEIAPGVPAPTLDLDLEAVDLPDHAPARGRTRAARSRRGNQL